MRQAEHEVCWAVLHTGLPPPRTPSCAHQLAHQTVCMRCSLEELKAA